MSSAKTSVRPADIAAGVRFRSHRTSQFSESVIREMTRLAIQHDAVNLAQGFPDFGAPDEIKRAAQDAIAADVNQYAITWGAKAIPRRHRGEVSKVVRHRLRSRERNYGLLRRYRRYDCGAIGRNQSR